MNRIEFWVTYQDATQKTAIYPGQGSITGLVYVALGLGGEAGEFNDQVKKVLRDDGSTLTAERGAKLQGELGDVLWYLARASRELNMSLGSVCAGFVPAAPTTPLLRGTTTGLALRSLKLYVAISRFADEVIATLEQNTQLENFEDLALQLSDIFGAAYACAADLGVTLETLADANMMKLLNRKDRGVLHGSGSDR